MTNVERAGATASLARASALAMGAVNTRDNIVRKSAKATFLAQLEEFVEQELQVQGVEKSGPGVEPSAVRLQVYREAVQFFMEEFKTWVTPPPLRARAHTCHRCGFAVSTSGAATLCPSRPTTGTARAGTSRS